MLPAYIVAVLTATCYVRLEMLSISLNLPAYPLLGQQHLLTCFQPCGTRLCVMEACEVNILPGLHQSLLQQYILQHTHQALTIVPW